MKLTESSNLLAVLDELDTHALSDSGVGLLGLDTDLLEDDALSVGGSTGGGGLVEVAERTLLVRLVRLHFPTKSARYSLPPSTLNAPSGSRDGRYGACALPAIHAVCWLYRLHRQSFPMVNNIGDVQPMVLTLRTVQCATSSNRRCGCARAKVVC